MPTLSEAVTFTGSCILDKLAFNISQTPKRNSSPMPSMAFEDKYFLT
ncbi:hypothetical protein [Shewanella sp. MBTL60-007]|nr:hypothetical protein [Shewanella sp. MBTL60-007]